MRKTVFVAVALATVYLGVTTPKISAQSLSVALDSKSVKNLLLAEVDEPKVSAKSETKASETAPAVPAPVIVTVQSGDSLSSIAAANNTTWVRLYNANESVANPNIINPGDQLRVPTADEQLADRALPQPVVVSAPAQSTYRASAPAASYPTDPNAAKAFIYSRESGNNPNATNPTGCYGLGQDCNGVLRAQCGADYACQDAYFDGYATRRYSSWEAAYAFWQANHWW
jgi:LysM repeat protein